MLHKFLNLPQKIQELLFHTHKIFLPKCFALQHFMKETVPCIYMPALPHLESISVWAPNQCSNHTTLTVCPFTVDCMIDNRHNLLIMIPLRGHIVLQIPKIICQRRALRTLPQTHCTHALHCWHVEITFQQQQFPCLSHIHTVFMCDIVFEIRKMHSVNKKVYVQLTQGTLVYITVNTERWMTSST